MRTKHNPIQVAPSILAGDFGYLAEEARRIEQAGADCIHVDIMDGHFVPNLTMGPAVLSAINCATDLFLDVHIMIYNPYDFIEPLVAAGADRITFHFEAVENVEEILYYIRKCNVQAGLAFRPETPVEFVPKYLPLADLVLLMTVSPGFGGQAFMPEVLDKVRFVRSFVEEKGLYFKNDKSHPYQIQVDGGIDNSTASLCIESGANILVAGTYLFEEGNMAEKIKGLKEA